ncbi:hypothetical protein BKA62DRAFT_24175 [Auriculariales sp. MPI-PUGE-AT-0066]|nr:hypothetical protein BKA62DRAFT_24175 [Auriculariales sp. MPI-PUGE-AT-0066]
MASSAFSYAETVNTNLICCICRAPFVNPVTTKSCAHTFCLDCIHTALDIVQQCPVDRSPLTILDLRAANPILRNLVDELLAECPYYGDGCQFTSQRQLLAAHLRNDCPFAPIACNHPGCDNTVPRRHLGRHEEACLPDSVSGQQCLDCGVRIATHAFESHSRACVAEEVQCEACLVAVTRAMLPAHTLVCPHFIEACPHAQAGCSWIDARHAQTSHLATCPFEHSALRLENHSLRSRLDVLEGIVRALQDESRTARTVLGPWLRDNSDDTLGITSQVSQLSVSPPSHTRPRRLSPLNAAMLRVATDAPYSPTQTTTPGNSVTSPTDGTPAATSSPAISSFTSTSTDESMFPYGYPSVTIQVPPLDTRGSLEMTLSGLRNSVTSLANALDSLGRRHDVALMTETLRMHEDVQSLRAIVHGLRMQVHQIMMERTAQAAAAQATLTQSLSLYRTSSGAPTAGRDSDPHNRWSTRTEYVNEHPPTGPPMVVAVRRTTENKL